MLGRIRAPVGDGELPRLRAARGEILVERAAPRYAGKSSSQPVPQPTRRASKEPFTRLFAVAGSRTKYHSAEKNKISHTARRSRRRASASSDRTGRGTRSRRPTFGRSCDRTSPVFPPLSCPLEETTHSASGRRHRAVAARERSGARLTSGHAAIVHVVLPRRIRDVAQLVGEALVVSIGAIDFDAAFRVAHRAPAVLPPAAQTWRTSPI